MESGGLEVREMAQKKNPPFNPSPIVFPLPPLDSELCVKFSFAAGRMNEPPGLSCFQLWLLTHLTPCHLYQPENLYNDLKS